MINRIEVFVWINHKLKYKYFLVLYSSFYVVPNDLYEAAEVDGAGRFHIMFKIALPIVMPVVFCLSYFTDLPFKYLLPIVLIVENLKLIPGLILVHKGIWVRQLGVK